MYKRELTGKLINRMKEKRHFIQVLMGARQTGKTTIVLQALEELSMTHHYISADDPVLFSPEWLRNEWEKVRLMQKQTGDEVIFAIDEVQNIPQWSAMVKQLWDEDSRKKTPIKVILTGSSSMLIQSGLQESMAGRFEVLYCSHWRYKECKEAFDYSLDDFLFFGGYPGAATLKNDIDRWVRYIGTSIVEPVISRDILLMEQIRKPALLRSLFTLGAMNSARELSYYKILGQLMDAGNTVTLAHYLKLLDQARILCGHQKYTETKIKTRQSSPRFMVYDTSLMVWAAGSVRKNFMELPETKGHLVESAVGACLLARGIEEGFSVFYWREREAEVDFVIENRANALTTIEVKSGRLKNSAGSMEFIRRYPHALSLTVGDSNCSLEDFLYGKIPLFK